MDPERHGGPDEATPAPVRPGSLRARALRLLLAMVLLVLASWLLAPTLLAPLGYWLARSDPLPAEAGALVVISGDPYGLREEEAARLWREGRAPVIITSGGPIAWKTVAAEVMEHHLRELGVPADAIQVEPRASSTAENAAFTLPMVKALGAQEVVVVTSNYHARRARLAFREVYEPEGVRVFVHGAPDPGFHPDHWWRDGTGREYGLLELAKLAWYLLPPGGS